MIITNFKNLAKNSLRKKTLSIAEAGYQAINIEKVVKKRVKSEKRKVKSFLIIQGENKKTEINLDDFKRIFLVGIGKGSSLACVSLAKILGEKLSGSVALDVKNLKSQIRPSGESPATANLKIFVGTHPSPSPKNIKATQKIIELIKNLKKDDLLIVFICGGGSALLCGSKKELKHSQTIFKELTKAGADIKELNIIRKHLSEVKGGGLAKLAYPASVISLIVSDVPGNDLSMVASGPTVFDKTTKKDAEKIIKKYLRPPAGQAGKSAYRSALIRVLAETPKNKKYFKTVKSVLFLSNREPVSAMAKKAKELGFKPKIYSLRLKGEAKEALLPLMKVVKKGEILLAAGETTVTLKSQISNRTLRGIASKSQKIGKGGRNMEVVLGAIARIPNDLAVLSIASDGWDNTEAAGAIADFSTLKKAEKLKLNPQEFLNNHNSFNFFRKTGDLIFAKKKTFNISDLMIILRE